MPNRNHRNRKRSKRRSIFCPTHGCYLDSVSQKHRLYADCAEHLQQRGLSRKRSLLLVANRTTISLDGEWLEAFWCGMCATKTWYHVCKMGDRTYSLKPAPQDLWQQVNGVIQACGNPSVGEFTYRHARRPGSQHIKDFNDFRTT